MTIEEIKEIVYDYQFDDNCFDKIAAEIHAKQEEEMKEIVNLLNDIQRFIFRQEWIKGETLGENLDREKAIRKRTKQFLKQQEGI